MRGVGGTPRGPRVHQKTLRKRDRHRMLTHHQIWPRSPKMKRRSNQKARRSGPKNQKPPSQHNRPTPGRKSQGTSVASPNQVNEQIFVKPPNMAKEKEEISFTAANKGQRKTPSRHNLSGRNHQHARPLTLHFHHSSKGANLPTQKVCLQIMHFKVW